jgi:hypothetical protein
VIFLKRYKAEFVMQYIIGNADIYLVSMSIVGAVVRGAGRARRHRAGDAVVGLYPPPPDRVPVLCVDEKSQIPALDRTCR